MSGMADMMAMMAPLIPSQQPVRNPVAEFTLNLVRSATKGAEEGKLIETIVVNNSNANPNGVIEMLIDLHNRIGDFVEALNNNEFDDWKSPEQIQAEESADKVVLISP